jgi:hypothetical protein
MKRISLWAIPLFVLFLVGCGSEAPSTKNLEGRTMTVSYSTQCTCCKNYIDYLDSHGLNVQRRTMGQAGLDMVKAEHNLKRNAQSCHTATIDGYLVEGHVPVQAIAKLLKEQPDDVQGITVPGMPRHSPGMGRPAGQYLPVQSVNEQGTITGTYTEVYY